MNPILSCLFQLCTNTRLELISISYPRLQCVIVELLAKQEVKWSWFFSAPISFLCGPAFLFLTSTWTLLSLQWTSPPQISNLNLLRLSSRPKSRSPLQGKAGQQWSHQRGPTSLLLPHPASSTYSIYLLLHLFKLFYVHLNSYLSNREASVTLTPFGSCKYCFADLNSTR